MFLLAGLYTGWLRSSKAIMLLEVNIFFIKMLTVLYKVIWQRFAIFMPIIFFLCILLVVILISSCRYFFLYFLISWLISFYFPTGFDNMPKRNDEPTCLKYGFVAIEHGGELFRSVGSVWSPFPMRPWNQSCSNVIFRWTARTRTTEIRVTSSDVLSVKQQRIDKTDQIFQKRAKIVKESYEVALLVAQNMKAHTITEYLVIPTTEILVRHVSTEE